MKNEDVDHNKIYFINCPHMKSLIFLLIPLLFLSSCSIDWNDEKDKKIVELEKQIQDDTFKKNKDCSEYGTKIELQIKEDINNRLYLFKYIKEIFYSKTQNSCFIITEEKDSTTLTEYYTIENLLSKERISFNKTSDIQLYGEKVKELKSE